MTFTVDMFLWFKVSEERWLLLLLTRLPSTVLILWSHPRDWSRCEWCVVCYAYNGISPSAKNYWVWSENIKNYNYLYLQQIVFSFLHALIYFEWEFRGGTFDLSMQGGGNWHKYSKPETIHIISVSWQLKNYWCKVCLKLLKIWSDAPFPRAVLDMKAVTREEMPAWRKSIKVQNPGYPAVFLQTTIG